MHLRGGKANAIAVLLYFAPVLIFCMVIGGECSESGVIVVDKLSNDGEIYAACNVVKYSNGTQFDTNLNALLKDLADKVAYTGFSSSVYGKENDPDKVSGRLQCRGDLSPADCRACSVEAVKSVRRDCPNAIGARVQLEYCFLRYEKYSFLSKLDTSFWYGLVNVNNDTDIKFNVAARGLMEDLSTKAPVSGIKFALGTTAVSSNLTLYGMEMCWRDMSREDCATCLSKGIERLFSCCSERVGVQIFLGSCTLRYEIYPFSKHY